MRDKIRVISSNSAIYRKQYIRLRISKLNFQIYSMQVIYRIIKNEPNYCNLQILLSRYIDHEK